MVRLLAGDRSECVNLRKLYAVRISDIGRAVEFRQVDAAKPCAGTEARYCDAEVTVDAMQNKGIATFEDVQTIFLDTPGIFEGDTRVPRAMVKSAWAAMRDADMTGVVLDVVEMYYVAKRSRREELSYEITVETRSYKVLRNGGVRIEQDERSRRAIALVGISAVRGLT